jgi:hypothetical protein
MKLDISKPDFKYIGELVVTWTFLNVTFNLFGLWINKLISKSNFEYLTDLFFEFVKPLLLQSFILTVCLIIGFTLFRNKKWAKLSFVIFQFIAFNLIFLMNLKFKNGIHFETTWENWGLLYYSFNGQYLIDLIYLFSPLEGNFDGNIFVPANSYIFYFNWVILTTVYFFLVTSLTFPILKFMKKK